MQRFFVPNADFHKKNISITDKNEIHHIVDVLRLKKGSQIELFNGKSEEAIGTILKLSHGNINVAIESVRRGKQTKEFAIVLACAIPKRAKFEFVIEKSTELGVDEIIPLITQRTEVQFDSTRASKKALRYKTVAINAAKQCRRLIIPVIHPITSFKDAIGNIQKSDTALIPCLEGERKDICDLFPIKEFCKRIIFFIGPEGDFTPQELSEAINIDCIPISLGPTVLKVDTAAISVVALANFFRIHKQ